MSQRGSARVCFRHPIRFQLRAGDWKTAPDRDWRMHYSKKAKVLCGKPVGETVVAGKKATVISVRGTHYAAWNVGKPTRGKRK